jgi:hypothetical protein
MKLLVSPIHRDGGSTHNGSVIANIMHYMHAKKLM